MSICIHTLTSEQQQRQRQQPVSWSHAYLMILIKLPPLEGEG